MPLEALIVNQRALLMADQRIGTLQPVAADRPTILGAGVARYVEANESIPGES